MAKKESREVMTREPAGIARPFEEADNPKMYYT